MKILHISPTYFPAIGGGELHLKAVSEHLALRGHDVTVLTMNVRSHWDLSSGSSGELPETEVIQGVKVVRVPAHNTGLTRALSRWVKVKGGWRSASLLFGSDGLEMTMREPQSLAMIPRIVSSDADIVSTMNWYWPPAYHAYLARRMKRFRLVGIPLFHTAHAWCEQTVYARMLSSCEAVVVNTSHEGQFAQRRGARRVEVAGVGIDPQDFLDRNGREIRQRYGLKDFPVIGFVGRQEEKKGVTKLIEAMPDVWKWNPEVRLVLAGAEPPQQRGLREAIEALPPWQKERVVRVGMFEAKDKASLFDAFDVFALPSTEESFGIAYLEAWACGKPVIGARIGATQCVIEDGVNGLLADPEDAQDIARVLVQLLSDPDARKRMGQSGRSKTLALHTWESVTNRIENLYSHLVYSRPVFDRASPAIP